jgi:16S rRNA processing protein RimM
LTDLERWLLAGIVGRPHGLDGSFRVGNGVPELLQAGAVLNVGGRERQILRRAGHDGGPIIGLEGCEDRAAADALRGMELLVKRERAPELDEDEWWATDLEGCSVHDGSVEVGVVTRLLGLPSCDVLEVARPGGEAQLLVPLIKDAVRAVDIEHRTIDVDLRFLGAA